MATTINKKELKKRLEYFAEREGKYYERGLNIKITNIKVIKNKVVYDLKVIDENSFQIHKNCEAGMHIMNASLDGKV